MTVDQPRPVEDTQAVLDGAFGHAGKPDELAAREYFVLADERQQAPVCHPRCSGRYCRRSARDQAKRGLNTEGTRQGARRIVR